jgi:hypothetical protein
MWISRLAGQDGPNRRSLPAGEFFHPLSILALVLLIVNDWYLKPSSWAPGLITGKLSDFTGLLFFPLLVTALVDSLLLGAFRLGAPVDFTLRRAKLAGAIALTAMVFVLIKLSPTANQAYVDCLGFFGLQAHVVRDPTDLLALAVLWVPWRIGLSEIARVPLGRMELILHRRGRAGVVIGRALHDIVPAGADPAHAQQLVQALEAFVENSSPENEREVEAKLAKIRDL